MKHFKRYIAEKQKDGQWKFRITSYSGERVGNSNKYFLHTPVSYGGIKYINKDKFGKLYSKSNYIMLCIENSEHDDLAYFKKLVIERLNHMIEKEESKINKYRQDIDHVAVGGVIDE